MSCDDVVDPSRLSALPRFQEDDGDDEDEDNSDDVDLDDLAGLDKSIKSIKTTIRAAHGLNVACREKRRNLWRGLLWRSVNGKEGAQVSANLFWETVKTCFGTTGRVKVM